MHYLTTVLVRVTQRKGQGMTEYAFILPAVALMAFLTYQAFGNTVVTLMNTIVAAV